MSMVFLDTVGLLAIWDEADQWHEAANRTYGALLEQRRRVVTTSYVLLECGNAAARKSYRQDVEDLRLLLENSQKLIHPTPADWETAWHAYQQGENDGAGIVDQVSFTVMRRLGLRQAFTNDRHFRAAGFEVCF